MIRKMPSPLAAYTRVLFELPASLWAAQIFLVGDFNHGQTSRTPLAQARDGVWRATLDLPVGHHYHFRYVVDGEWRTDNYADGFATLAEECPACLIDLT